MRERIGYLEGKIRKPGKINALKGDKSYENYSFMLCHGRKLLFWKRLGKSRVAGV